MCRRVPLNRRSATRELEAAYDDLAESVAENGTSLDITTAAGRENEAALDAIAKKALEAAASTLEQTGSQDAANKTLATGRQRLIDMLAQFGITGAKAEEYADKLGLIKENIGSAVKLTGVDEAQSRIDRFITQNNGQTIRIRVAADGASMQVGRFNVTTSATGNIFDKGKQVTAYAGGGMASGIFPPVVGGIQKFAEAGWAESFITMNPAFRDRSLDIWAETGRRLGAWQPAPSSDARVAAPQQMRGGPAYTFTGDMYGIDPQMIAGEVNKEVRRAIAVSGLHEGVGD